MVRPNYESAEDLARQAIVIGVACSHWRCMSHRLPKFAEIDYILHRDGAPTAVAEVKCRRNPAEQYPTLILSSHKWMALLDHHRVYDVAALLVVDWLGDVRWLSAVETHVSGDWHLGIGGRSDRDDDQDNELVIHIPTNRFKPLGRVLE